jgi:hypothetical protein
MNPDNTEETIPDDLNKAPDAPNKELRETKRREFNERVAQVVEIARKKGTKEREIGAMLKKEYEGRKHGNQDPLGTSHLAPYSQRSPHSKLIGSGKSVSPSEKSPYSTATPAWANPCSLLILPPAYQPGDQCLTAHRVSRAVSSS